MRDGRSLLRSRHREGGFTLVELIVSIGILGVVMVAVFGILFATLNANRASQLRINSTRSEQFAVQYFADDVQGAKASGGIITSGTAQCGTRPLLIEFRGDTYDPSAVTTARFSVTTYALVATTVNGVSARELRRLTCEAAAGAATPLTPSRDVVVARALADETPAAPTVSGSQVSITLKRLDGTTFNLVGKRRTS